MGMGMGFSLQPRLLLICRVCDESLLDHEEGCPVGAITKLAYAEKRYRCPDCRNGNSVLLNIGDYLECRKCRAVFSAGLPGYTEDKPKFVLFEQGSDDFDSCRTVWRLDGLGAGEFRLDAQMKPLIALRDRLLAEKYDEEDA